jgi:hypothetical protein
LKRQRKRTRSSEQINHSSLFTEPNLGWVATTSFCMLDLSNNKFKISSLFYRYIL